MLASQRTYARRIGPLAVVVAFAITACGSDSEGGEAVQSEPPAASQAGEIVCGRPFTLPPPGALTLTGRFADRAQADRQVLAGTVTVMAEEAVSGVAAAAAGAFLVREGRVVTTPLPQDAVGVKWELDAGERKQVPATASLISCEQGGGPVPPGDYEIYAQFAFTPDDGTTTTAYGGPWPLRVE